MSQQLSLAVLTPAARCPCSVQTTYTPSVFHSFLYNLYYQLDFWDKVMVCMFSVVRVPTCPGSMGSLPMCQEVHISPSDLEKESVLLPIQVHPELVRRPWTRSSKHGLNKLRAVMFKAMLGCRERVQGRHHKSNSFFAHHRHGPFSCAQTWLIFAGVLPNRAAYIDGELCQRQVSKPSQTSLGHQCLLISESSGRCGQLETNAEMKELH